MTPTDPTGSPLAAVPAIPEGHALFHVGLPKTGTSSLQHAMWAQATALLERGVFYPAAPGARLKHHHVEAAGNAMFRLPEDGPAPSGWVKRAKPWDALMKVAAKSKAPRLVISAENASRASTAQVGPLVESLPRPAHVVITLRNFAELMPSMWQQRVRGGLEATTFDDFTRVVLAGKPDPLLHAHVQRRFDTANLIADWAQAVGADNVTVACVDKREPTLIFDLFNAMLGLPQGLLVRDPETPLNRSMSYVETELARQVILATEGFGFTREERNTFLLRAGFRRVQEVRVPPADEAPIRLTKAAVARAAEIAAEQAQQVKASGVRVVGDLDAFTARADHLVGTNPTVESVPTDLAVDMVIGGVLRALERNPLTGEARAPHDE